MAPRQSAPLGGEMLCGAAPIAAFMGVKRRQVYHWAEHGELPVFRIGRTLCARPDRLRAWITEQEAASASKAPAT